MVAKPSSTNGISLSRASAAETSVFRDRTCIRSLCRAFSSIDGCTLQQSSPLRRRSDAELREQHLDAVPARQNQELSAEHWSRAGREARLEHHVHPNVLLQAPHRHLDHLFGGGLRDARRGRQQPQPSERGDRIEARTGDDVPRLFERPELRIDQGLLGAKEQLHRKTARCCWLSNKPKPSFST